MEKLLTEVCNIQYGYPFDSSKFSETEGVPLIRIRDVTRGYSETFTTEEYKSEYLVYSGDLLIGMDGEFNIARWGEIPALLNQRVCRLIPSKAIDKGYLYYYMPTALKEIEAKTPFVTVKHLSAKELNKIKIPLPPLDEQRKIAAVLDKVSDLIAKRRQQLDKLDEMVKARFVETFGDPIINNMSWPKALIGDNCFVTKLAGFEYTQYIHYEDSGDVVMVKAQNVKKGKLNDKDISFISNEVSDSLPRSQLAPGDVVMTYVGANIGDVALIDEKHKYHLAPNVAKIRPNSKVYDSTYFMYMLMFLNSYIMENSADTAKAALGMERIRKLVVCIPPIDLQRYFSDFVKKIDKSKSVVQKSLEQMEILKKALIQECFG